MTNRHRAIAFLFSLLLALQVSPSPVGAIASEQELSGACTLDAAFTALHASVPDIVGACLAPVWSDQISGDAAQLTTTGVLLWRQTDATAHFTDGLAVWSDHPTGASAQPLTDALFNAPAAAQTDAHDGQPLREFRVDSVADLPDAAPGDGVCATDTGACTLRAAVLEANASPGLHRVVLPAGVYKLGIEGPGEDHAATGDLDVTGDLHFVGDGPGETYLQGAGIDRVLDVHAGARVQVRGLRIRRGSVWNDDGAGIRNAGTLTLIDANVSSNKAFDGRGGGIFTLPGSATILVRTSVWHNKATDERGDGRGSGGGIHNHGALWLLNVTLANNQADGGAGGGLLNRAVAIMTNSTVIANGAGAGGGGVESRDGLSQIQNSVIASSLQGDDCAGTLVSRGHNLIERPGDCDLPGDTASTIVGRDPRMGGLIEDGPRAGSRELLADSPVIDAGMNVGCPTDDLRQAPRPRPGRPGGAAICDIGAVERQPQE